MTRERSIATCARNNTATKYRSLRSILLLCCRCLSLSLCLAVSHSSERSSSSLSDSINSHVIAKKNDIESKIYASMDIAVSIYCLPVFLPVNDQCLTLSLQRLNIRFRNRIGVGEVVEEGSEVLHIRDVVLTLYLMPYDTLNFLKGVAFQQLSDSILVLV